MKSSLIVMLLLFSFFVNAQELLSKGINETTSHYELRMKTQISIIKKGSKVTIPRKTWHEITETFQDRMRVQNIAAKVLVGPRNANETTSDFNKRMAAQKLVPNFKINPKGFNETRESFERRLDMIMELAK